MKARLHHKAEVHEAVCLLLFQEATPVHLKAAHTSGGNPLIPEHRPIGTWSSFPLVNLPLPQPFHKGDWMLRLPCACQRLLLAPLHAYSTPASIL